jgi:hypothetical protein
VLTLGRGSEACGLRGKYEARLEGANFQHDAGFEDYAVSLPMAKTKYWAGPAPTFFQLCRSLERI